MPTTAPTVPPSRGGRNKDFSERRHAPRLPRRLSSPTGKQPTALVISRYNPAACMISFLLVDLPPGIWAIVPDFSRKNNPALWDGRRSFPHAASLLWKRKRKNHRRHGPGPSGR